MSTEMQLFLAAAVLMLGLSALICRRAYARWKVYRERTRVRREYWGYE